MDEKKIDEMNEKASDLSFPGGSESRAMYFVGLVILELAEAIKNAQEIKEKGEQK